MATILVKVILGSIAFPIFWILAVFPAVPFLPTGRTAGSLLGAMLMVLFQVISTDEAYDSIDLSILGLLFGTMVVSVYLKKADAFKYLGRLLSWNCLGAKDLLCRICEYLPFQVLFSPMIPHVWFWQSLYSKLQGNIISHLFHSYLPLPQVPILGLQQLQLATPKTSL